MLKRINRRGLTVKVQESLGIQQPPVGLLAGPRKPLEHRCERQWLRCAEFVFDRCGRDSGDQQLKVVGRRDKISELLRDRLALFGEPDGAAEGIVRQRFEKAMRGARAAAHRSAAAVEKPDPHTGIAPELCQPRLRFLEPPLAGKNA